MGIFTEERERERETERKRERGGREREREREVWVEIIKDNKLPIEEANFLGVIDKKILSKASSFKTCVDVVEEFVRT